MKKSRLAWIAGGALALLSGALASAASPPESNLTFKDAIRIALDHSPSVDSATRTQSVRDLQYRSAIAKLLPSLDLSTTDGLQNNIPISSDDSTSLFEGNPSSPWYSNLTLGVTESLYDNGVSLTNISIAGLQKQVADVTAAKTRDDLLLSVSTDYYAYSLNQMLLDVRKEQQRLLEKQFDILSSQYEEGFKTRADYLRLKTQLQRAEIDRITAEDALSQSVAQLRQDLGVNLEPEEQTPEGFVPVSVQRERDFPELQSATAMPEIQDFYTFRLMKLQDELNERNVDLARRSFWPQVNVSGGVAYNNQNYINSSLPFAAGHELSWDALVSVNFNIWDWGTKRRDIEIAAFNRQIGMDTNRLGLQGDQSKIEQLMAELKKIGRSYRLSRELLGMEEESNELLERQYREGKVTYLDLITSLDNLLQARIQFYTSYFDALQSLVKYRYYQGKIYDELAGE